MTDTNIILLAHGAGGKKSNELVRNVFLRHFGNPALNTLGDAAMLEGVQGRLAFTTDGFVVDPLIFPGGDIGKLAVCGTVNDLAAGGAVPQALSAAFIIEEGLPLETLETVVASMARTAAEVGVPIVTGDTKVVARGSADKLFITTSGLGAVPGETAPPSPARAVPGDMVVINGPVADHGMAVMTAREGLRLTTEIRSDCAPLAGLVAALREVVPDIHCLRDPTRGGLAAALNELAASSGVCIEIDEDAIPISEGVRVACELLGIDPLHVANEGKMLAILPAASADAALAAWQHHPLGAQAAVIGRVTDTPAGRVHLRTPLGSLRILDVPAGELLPRIC